MMLAARASSSLALSTVRISSSGHSRPTDREAEARSLRYRDGLLLVGFRDTGLPKQSENRTLCPMLSSYLERLLVTQITSLYAYAVA